MGEGVTEAERQGIVLKPPVPGRQWIACDLDHVLSFYDRWRGRTHIGKPIPAMVQRIKDHLAKGDVVIIFTSRVADPSKPDHAEVLAAIHKWCEEHIGERLLVSATKHNWYSVIYDDAAIRVERNTGALI